MKTTATHFLYLRRLRMFSLGLVWALVAVSATTVMIGWLSSINRPHNGTGSSVSYVTPPARLILGTTPSADDTLLYERLVGPDRRSRWVLADETRAQDFASATRDSLAIVDVTAGAPSLRTVSYALQAKPAGWNRLIKTCVRTGAVTVAGDGAYSLTCATPVSYTHLTLPTKRIV